MNKLLNERNCSFSDLVFKMDFDFSSNMEFSIINENLKIVFKNKKFQKKRIWIEKIERKFERKWNREIIGKYQPWSSWLMTMENYIPSFLHPQLLWIFWNSQSDKRSVTWFDSFSVRFASKRPKTFLVGFWQFECYESNFSL